jgi:DNA-binding CsgD family transcriptional regulator
MRRIPVRVLSAQTVQIIRLLERGLSLQAIVDALNLTYPTVNNVAQRWKAKTYANTLPALSAEPPSLAMVRLAEFDPVIKRALEQREGEIRGEEP